MVITSKEQEKDLRAYTCKNCKSTLFIAKNREWFFEGDTGLAGLGCYACGAKGQENFVMDRDRIVEDVGDMDDYFDYERPLDFVTAAERRALLKKAQGNEELANEMLMAQEKASKGKEASVMEAEVVDVATPVAASRCRNDRCCRAGRRTNSAEESKEEKEESEENRRAQARGLGCAWIG
jgi:hypothetical protein